MGEAQTDNMSTKHGYEETLPELVKILTLKEFK